MENYNFRVGANEPEYIDITNNWEMNYWSSQLKCTKEELLIAAKEIGTKIEDIREFIILIHSGKKNNNTQ